jgi:hypothetical protein
MKFRKKPEALDAWQFTKKNFRDGVPRIFKHESVFLWSQYGGDVIGGEIETTNGKCAIFENDWLVKNINGEFYACKPDIFEATYESV